MPSKTADVDPAAVKGWIADARKKPVSFALLVGQGGLVMQADKVKSPDQMRKAAKAAGGTKGCWGKMEVQQKTLVLTYEGNPPGGFEKQVRKLLTDAGAAMRVDMVSLAEAEAGAAAEEERAEEEARVAEEAARPEREPEPDGDDAEPTAAASPDDTEALEGDEDAAAGEDEEEEPSDLPTVLKLARKKPLNFACLFSDDGVVLVTHRRKNWGILIKQAKGLGGSAKGGWGTLSVEGKQVVLSCVEDPPGTLARRLKIKLRSEGQKYSVAVRSPSGEAVEPEDDERVEAGAGGQGSAPAAPPPPPAVPVEEELAQAAGAIDRVRGAMTAKQSKMFEKLTETAQAQSAASPSKASATVKLLMQKLDALGLEPVETASAGGVDDGELLKRRKTRLSDIAALRARADAVMARILERQA